GLTTSPHILANYTFNEQGQHVVTKRANQAAAITIPFYDNINRLTGYTQNLAGTADDENQSFGYDPSGQITTRADSNIAYTYVPTGRLNTVADTVSGTTTTTGFLYDGDLLVAEYVSGTLTERYVPSGLGGDTPLTRTDGTGTVQYYLIDDNQGSIAAKTDNT